MSDWYIDVVGEVKGPLSSSELLDKLRKGEIDQDTPIRKDDSQWVPAHEVNGLMEAALGGLKRLACPYCGHETTKPPTTCRKCERYLTRVLTTYDQPRSMKNGSAVLGAKAAAKSVNKAVKDQTKRFKGLFSAVNRLLGDAQTSDDTDNGEPH